MEKNEVKGMCTPARKAYDEALALADKTFQEARKAHLEAVAQADKAYGEAVAQIRKVTQEAEA